MLGNSASSSATGSATSCSCEVGAPRCPPTPAHWPGCTSKEIASRISKVLETTNLNIDDTSRAHLEECRHRIAKVLEANLDVSEP